MDSAVKMKHISVIKKYPAIRDNFVNGSWKWIEGKRKDDYAEGLWRVHDKLYDLTEFIPNHPGGKSWLEITKVRSFKCKGSQKKPANFVLSNEFRSESRLTQ